MIKSKNKKQIETHRQSIVKRDGKKQNSEKSDDLYRTLFQLAADSIVLIDPVTSEIVKFNDSAHQNLGYSREEFEKIKIKDLDVQEPPEKFFNRTKKIAKGLPLESFETMQKGKDGTVRNVHVCGSSITFKGKKYILSIWRDITELKKYEYALKEKEFKLSEQAKNLEETNTALKVLLRIRNEEKEGLEENILSNVTQLIYPYLTKLSRTKLNAEQMNYLKIVESNMKAITSSLVPKLASGSIGLTPRELEVANLVKNGLSNQEISDALCLSDNAISFHRKNIRSKLKLKGKKINLRTYLQNLS
jgi:PAS domain S-box-containing protein